jgi:hypothetical protein
MRMSHLERLVLSLRPITLITSTRRRSDLNVKKQTWVAAQMFERRCYHDQSPMGKAPEAHPSRKVMRLPEIGSMRQTLEPVTRHTDNEVPRFQQDQTRAAKSKEWPSDTTVRHKTELDCQNG